MKAILYAVFLFNQKNIRILFAKIKELFIFASDLKL